MVQLLACTLLFALAFDPSIPSGTAIVVRTIDPVDSRTADPGKTFTASLAEPLMVGNSELASKGARVLLKVVEVRQAGALTGAAGIMIAVESIEIDSHMIRIESRLVTSESAAKGKSTGKKMALGGVLGTVVGGIKGGKTGAAVGGAAGVGTGALLSAVSSETVSIPSETRLTFVVR